MPYTLKRKGSQWCVHRRGAGGRPVGRSFGCHPTKKKALRQLAALSIHAKGTEMKKTKVARRQGRDIKENRYTVRAALLHLMKIRAAVGKHAKVTPSGVAVSVPRVQMKLLGLVKDTQTLLTALDTQANINKQEKLHQRLRTQKKRVRALGDRIRNPATFTNHKKTKDLALAIARTVAKLYK